MMLENRYVTTLGAAQVAGVSIRSIYRWVQWGYLTPVPALSRNGIRVFRVLDVLCAEAKTRPHARRGGRC